MAAKPDLAYYYPYPYWHNGDWVKNLLLYFDGIAILLPRYMRGQEHANDPAIVEGLREHDLLHIIEPEKAVNKAATKKLAKVMTEVITSGALDSLTTEGTAFHEISMSRLGYDGDVGLAEAILAELKKRGLAKDSEDGVSVPLHPKVRHLILVLLAQILRPHGDQLGSLLSPVTDSPAIVSTLEELLRINAPSPGSIVSFDMNVVGVDVGSFPLDEVLGFKKDNKKALFNYRRQLRMFADQLSRMSPTSCPDAFEERQQELDDLGVDLRRASRQAWRKPAAFALSLTGAAWSAIYHNPIAAMLSTSAAMIGYSGAARPKLGAYSYVFSAAGRFRY